jgi:cell division protein FtsZ
MLTPPEAEEAEVAATVSFVDDAVSAEPEPLVLDEPIAEDTGSDELLLDSPTSSGPSEADLEAGRRWLSGDAEPAAEAQPAPAKATGGTLFERMSIIARGAAKTPGDEEGKESPLDIPRFLNRQNNQ